MHPTSVHSINPSLFLDKTLTLAGNIDNNSIEGLGDLNFELELSNLTSLTLTGALSICGLFTKSSSDDDEELASDSEDLNNYQKENITHSLIKALNADTFGRLKLESTLI